MPRHRLVMVVGARSDLDNDWPCAVCSGHRLSGLCFKALTMLKPNEAPPLRIQSSCHHCGTLFTSDGGRRKTVTISPELSDAYVALLRAAEFQIKYHREHTVEMLGNAVEQVIRAGGGK